jgi:hypothetical protein
MELENIMLIEVSSFRKTKVTYFSHMWKIGPNTNTRIIMCPKVGLRRERRRE